MSVILAGCGFDGARLITTQQCRQRVKQTKDRRDLDWVRIDAALRHVALDLNAFLGDSLS
jgi:hypothetical protein